MADSPSYQKIAPDVKLGRGVRIYAFTNFYGCQIGDDVKNRHLCRNSKRGQHRRIAAKSPATPSSAKGWFWRMMFSSATTSPSSTISTPAPPTQDGQLQTEADWKCIPTRVERGASIGSGATLLCGITVGQRRDRRRRQRGHPRCSRRCRGGRQPRPDPPHAQSRARRKRRGKPAALAAKTSPNAARSIRHHESSIP